RLEERTAPTAARPFEIWIWGVRCLYRRQDRASLCLRDPERRRLLSRLVIEEAQPPAEPRRQLPGLLHPEDDPRPRVAREPGLDLLGGGQGEGPPVQVEADDPEKALARKPRRQVGRDRLYPRRQPGDGGGQVVQALHRVDRGLDRTLDREEEKKDGEDD